MSCVEKLPHSCGSSDALQIFEENGQYTGFCFSCSTYEPDPYGDHLPPETPKPRMKPKVRNVDQEKAWEIQRDYINQLPALAIPERGITQETAKFYGIRTQLKDGKPYIYYFPYYKGDSLVAYKARLAQEKKFYCLGSQVGADPFGWIHASKLGNTRLFITEGEWDAASVWQIISEKQKGTQWESSIPAAISLPNGSWSVIKALSPKVNEINGLFKEVILAYDMDENGSEAAKDTITILPGARVAKLPAKDANDALTKGFKQALFNSIMFKTIENKNTRIVVGTSLHEEARKPAEYGLSWPWPTLTKFTRGIRPETYYIGAGVKMGKSEVCSEIARHFIVEHNSKVFVAKPEEPKIKTYKIIAGKVTSRVFHDPDLQFDYEKFDEAKEIIGDKLLLLDVWQHLGWETLRQDIITAVSQGAKAVFIDPITNLTNGIDSGQTNTILQGIAQDLAAIAKDLNVPIFIFCHLKAPEQGASHERGGKVNSHQFAGSRAMMRSCNYMIGLEGNKDPDLPEEERNIRKLIILEDREFGISGYLRLYRQTETGRYWEMDEDKGFLI